jgi:hypothetical protein
MPWSRHCRSRSSQRDILSRSSLVGCRLRLGTAGVLGTHAVLFLMQNEHGLRLSHFFLRCWQLEQARTLPDFLEVDAVLLHGILVDAAAKM